MNKNDLLRDIYSAVNPMDDMGYCMFCGEDIWKYKEAAHTKDCTWLELKRHIEEINEEER